MSQVSVLEAYSALTESKEKWKQKAERFPFMLLTMFSHIKLCFDFTGMGSQQFSTQTASEAVYTVFRGTLKVGRGI